MDARKKLADRRKFVKLFSVVAVFICLLYDPRLTQTILPHPSRAGSGAYPREPEERKNFYPALPQTDLPCRAVCDATPEKINRIWIRLAETSSNNQPRSRSRPQAVSARPSPRLSRSLPGLSITTRSDWLS